jgi:hypothetical protein
VCACVSTDRDSLKEEYAYLDGLDGILDCEQRERGVRICHRQREAGRRRGALTLEETALWRKGVDLHHYTG